MRVGWWLAASVFLLVDCSSTSSTNNVDPCSPGEEVECRVDGCSGLKACRSDGNGYEPCVCGGGGSAGSNGSGGDSAAGGDDSSGGASGGLGGSGTGGDGTAGNGGAAGSSPRCDIDAPFEGVQPLNDINTASDEFRASLSEDLLTVHFGSGSEIYRATRTAADGLFEQITPLPAVINTEGADWPHLSRDGRELFFARQGDLFRATRSDVAAEFGTPTPLSNINAPSAVEYMGSVSGDGALLVFNSNRNDSSDIFTARLVSPGTYGNPVPLDEVNSAQGDTDPVVTPDALAIYFASDRPPSEAGDIWVARRSSVDEDFAAPERVAGLNTINIEHPTWIASDECMILFASDRLGGDGGWDFFLATRPTSP